MSEKGAFHKLLIGNCRLFGGTIILTSLLVGGFIVLVSVGYFGSGDSTRPVESSRVWGSRHSDPKLLNPVNIIPVIVFLFLTFLFMLIVFFKDPGIIPKIEVKVMSP